MRRNRIVVMMLVIVTVLAMATTALAGRPNKPGKPEPPDIWTCAERVKNGAVWVPGDWNGAAYVSDLTVKVDVPLCIDLDFLDVHKYVTAWTVTWEDGKTVRKDPKGLMLIFEEALPGTHYAEKEVSQPGMQGTWYAELDLEKDGDGNPVNEHLVFVAMPRQGDEWESITFTVTPER